MKAASARVGRRHCAASIEGRILVNLQRLAKQLRREMAANPKKAAMLGVLALVALYFWAPLVSGWFSAGSAETVESLAALPAPVYPAMPGESAYPAGPVATVAMVAPRWRDLVDWIEQDPRMQSAALAAGTRDPFVAPQKKSATEMAQTPPKENPLPVLTNLTPASLNLVLTSTIVGPELRVARINGQTYKTGEILELIKDGHEIQFTLVEIGPKEVILQREGQRFSLKLTPRKSNGKFELIGTTR